MSQVAEDLKAVRKLLTNPYRWSNRGDAFTEVVYHRKNKNTLRVMVDGNHQDAVCWCVTGGLIKVISESNPTEEVGRYDAALAVLSSLVKGKDILDAAFGIREEYDMETVVQMKNDRSSHARLLRWLDKGIAKAEAYGPS